MVDSNGHLVGVVNNNDSITYDDRIDRIPEHLCEEKEKLESDSSKNQF